MKMSGHAAREFSATWKATDPKTKVMAALATATKTGKRKSRHTSEMRAFNSIGPSLNGGHSRRESKSAARSTVASPPRRQLFSKTTGNGDVATTISGVFLASSPLIGRSQKRTVKFF
jgi:hypothetical protein